MTVRAAIYRRISTTVQEDNTSLDVQEETCRAHATKQGYDVVGVYTDVHSGADLWSRPDVNRLLADAENGRFDVLVCYHTDRVSREPDHLAYIRVVLKQHGVRVESVMNPRTDSFEDQLMASFEALFSKHERTRIQQRMATGRRARAEKEQRLLPGGQPLFGYQWDDPGKSAKNRYVEDPSTSWIVRRIYEEAVEGRSLRGIATGLNADGLRTANGRKWQARQISRVMENPAYKGEFYANRYRVEKDPHTGRRHDSMRPESEWILVEGAAPALVSAETWRRANDRLQRNKVEQSRPYDRKDALLRAGFVYCAHCGKRMNVARLRGQIFYKCSSVYWGGNGACRGWSVKAGPVDAFVWGRVESWLGDPGVLMHEAERSRSLVAESLEDDVDGLDRALARLDTEQSNLVEALSRLNGSAADPVVDKLNDLASRRDALRQRREEAVRRSELAAKAGDAMASFWDAVLAYADEVGEWTYEQKREMLHRLGVRVTVEKRGRAAGRFWVEATPPWPEGTEWWLDLFGDSYRAEQGIGEDGDGEGGVTDLPSSLQASGSRRSIAKSTSSEIVRIATGTIPPSSRRVSGRSSTVTMCMMTSLYRSSVWCPCATQSLDRVWISTSPVRRRPPISTMAFVKSGPKPWLQVP